MSIAPAKNHLLSLVINVAKEDNLKVFSQALASAGFADEIIIYNLEVEPTKLKPLVKKYNPQIISLKRPKIIEEIRERQVRETKGNWVLILDSDEILSKTLAKEIKISLTTPNPQIGAYALPRQNYSLGYRIKHGGWNDDYQIRLIYKPNFVSWPKVIHTLPQVKGKIAKLNSPLYHYKDSSLSFIVNKTNRYSDAEAELFYRGGLKPVTSLTILRKMAMEIFRRGILKLGILDGAIGIIQSIYQGFSVFITYAKLYEKQINN